MLPLLPFFPISQIIAQTVPTAPPPEEVVLQQEVRALPGRLNNIPTFNSNSPELVLQEGILLSTFPTQGKKNPSAHLNYSFRGRFDIFAHHVAKANNPEDERSLYLGIVLYNPTNKPVKVNILQAASYLSQPDAPFIARPAFSINNDGSIYAGPGDRATGDVLRGKRQEQFPREIIIPPGKNQILLNLPIPVKGLTPPLNGRSTLMRLSSSGRVYAASLAMFAPKNSDGSERPPTLEEWETLLNNGELSSPRDKVPTPLEQTDKPIIYGRVAGVSQGSEWRSLITDNPGNPKSTFLTIPKAGQAYSYILSSLHRGTLETGQIQSSPMLARYPDTAYRAHGNYALQYSLKLPLYNNTPQSQTVSIAMQTPIKEDKLSKQGLRFFAAEAKPVFFRGSVRIRYRDDKGKPQTQFIHLVQKRGQQGQPLVVLNMKQGDRRLVEVDLIYPPDATPPQVLTVKTQ
jgi:hypothetical protein